MVGIGPAISKTGVTGGSKQGAKPGAVGANKNNGKVSKLSLTDVKEKEKAIKEGEDTGEVSKEEDKKDTGATTTGVDAEENAKKAVTPRDRLNGHLEEMGKRLDEHKANMDKGMMDAQNMAAQQQGMDPAMLAALQKPQQSPKSGGSSGSGSKPQSRPSTKSNSDTAKKLAESQQRMKDSFDKKLKSYEEKTSETISKLKKENEELKRGQGGENRVGDLSDRARRATESENARSSGNDSSISQKFPLTREDITKASDLLKEVRKGGGTPEQNKEILDNFDKIIGKLDDGEMKTNMQSIRDRFEEKSQIAESDPDKTSSNNKPESSRGELEDYDLNSFDPSNIADDTETQASTDTNADLDSSLERSIDRTIEETTNNATEQAQEQAQEMAEEQAEQEAQEEIDRQIEEMQAELDAELEEL